MSCRTDKQWHRPPCSLHLDSTDVHLWRANLDLPAPKLLEFKQHLSSSESCKANRFRYQIHRNRYIARHAILRLILKRYLKIPPVEIIIKNRNQGKPVLSSRHDSPICFNMSSSKNIALFAVAREREVGVDIERINPTIAGESIPELFFSVRETSTLRALPEEIQARAFFDCWSRKEAYIKALGTGLSLALNSFDVSLEPDKPAALLCTRNDSDKVNHWFMQSLDAGPAYSAALVVEDEGKDGELKLQFWEWH